VKCAVLLLKPGTHCVFTGHEHGCLQVNTGLEHG